MWDVYLEMNTCKAFGKNCKSVLELNNSPSVFERFNKNF